MVFAAGPRGASPSILFNEDGLGPGSSGSPKLKASCRGSSQDNVMSRGCEIGELEDGPAAQKTFCFIKKHASWRPSWVKRMYKTPCFSLTRCPSFLKSYLHHEWTSSWRDDGNSFSCTCNVLCTVFLADQTNAPHNPFRDLWLISWAVSDTAWLHSALKEALHYCWTSFTYIYRTVAYSWPSSANIITVYGDVAWECGVSRPPRALQHAFVGCWMTINRMSEDNRLYIS